MEWFIGLGVASLLCCFCFEVVVGFSYCCLCWWCLCLVCCVVLLMDCCSPSCLVLRRVLLLCLGILLFRVFVLLLVCVRFFGGLVWFGLICLGFRCVP